MGGTTIVFFAPFADFLSGLCGLYFVFGFKIKGSSTSALRESAKGAKNSRFGLPE
jgi:hypothetical protein